MLKRRERHVGRAQRRIAYVSRTTTLTASSWLQSRTETRHDKEGDVCEDVQADRREGDGLVGRVGVQPADQKRRRSTRLLYQSVAARSRASGVPDADEIEHTRANGRHTRPCELLRYSRIGNTPVSCVSNLRKAETEKHTCHSLCRPRASEVRIEETSEVWCEIGSKKNKAACKLRRYSVYSESVEESYLYQSGFED